MLSPFPLITGCKSGARPPARASATRTTLLALLWLLLAGNIVRSTEQPGNAPWWRDAVFYEIFVRSFADSAAGPRANDGIGDLQGLIDHLDYLNDGRGPAGSSLGVTALWLMPIQPSPSYHGYDVTDYFAVNPQYGDAALFKRFIAEAHRRGIRVIIDFVLNHCSSSHPLFLAALASPPNSAARALFRFAPLPEELFGPWEQRVWHPGGGAFYYGVFDAGMPDWNFRNPAVTEHHRRAAAFWLKEMGVDGFRLDAVRYFFEQGDALQDTEETRAWLREFTDYCHSIKPDAFVIAENTARSREIARWVESGATDSSFEFDLARATYEAIRLRAPAILARAQQTIEGMYGGDPRWATLLSNHDQERVVTQLNGSVDQALFAAKLLFTTPGVPFIYYGDELGMRGAKPDPQLRTPMPWTAQPPNAGFSAPNAKPWHELNPDFRTVNVATEAGTPDSPLTLYRRLIRLNASSPALRHGTSVRITAGDPRIYVAMRASEQEVVLVLANFGEASVRDIHLNATGVPLRNVTAARDELTGLEIAAPSPDAEGNVRNWQPVPELAPLDVYVARWRR